MHLKKKEKYILIILAVAVIVFLFLPLQLPVNIEVQGKLIPEREWYLLRDGNGSITVVLNNNLSNMVSSSRVYVAERGDIIDLQLQAKPNAHEMVQVLDSVATIRSSAYERQMVSLERKLANSQSDLDYFRSGSKQESITEARQRLALAETRLEQAQKESTRQEALYRGELISKEVFESAQSDLHLRQIDVNIAQAALQSISSGAKPEQIKRIEQEIRGYNQEIIILKERQNKFVLRAPFSGKLVNSFSSDTLLFLADTSRILLVPVSTDYFAQVNMGQSVQMRAGKVSFSGSIIKKTVTKTYLSNKPIFMAFARLDQLPEGLPFYTILSGTIDSGSMTPLAYVGQLINSILGRG